MFRPFRSFRGDSSILFFLCGKLQGGVFKWFMMIRWSVAVAAILGLSCVAPSPISAETLVAGFTLPFHIPGLPRITLPVKIPGFRGALPKPVFAVSQSGRNCPSVSPKVSVDDGVVSIVYPSGTQFGTSGEVACIVGLTYQVPEGAQLVVNGASFSGKAVAQGMVMVAGGISDSQGQKAVFSSTLPVTANSSFSAESLPLGSTRSVCASGFQVLQIVIGANGPVQLDALRVNAGFVSCP